MVNVRCSLLWLRHQPSNEATEKLFVAVKIESTAVAETVSADCNIHKQSRQTLILVQLSTLYIHLFQKFIRLDGGGGYGPVSLRQNGTPKRSS